MKYFPKVDLHHHLEGSISPETLLRVAEEYGGRLPTYNLEELRARVQADGDAPGFENFLNKFKVFRCFYTCREAVQDIVTAAVRDAAADSIKYLELRYSPSHFACSGRFAETDVVAWVQDAITRAAARYGIIVCPVLTISRDYGLELAESTVRMAAGLPQGFFYGLDIAGNEAANPALPFADLFAMSKSAGLGLTIHAGEAGGAENVREAVDVFDADRIGHGIRAADDPDVMELLHRKDRMLEVCLTSNLQTGAVDSIKNHPVRKLLQHGVPVSLNTDDPAISAITLTGEYVLAIAELGFTENDLKALNRAALNHSFYPDKQELNEKLAHYWE